MEKLEDRYLGDGVYASSDGYHIILDLRGQDNFTRIGLDPEVMNELLKFQKDAFPEKEESPKNKEQPTKEQKCRKQ